MIPGMAQNEGPGSGIRSLPHLNNGPSPSGGPMNENRGVIAQNPAGLNDASARARFTQAQGGPRGRSRGRSGSKRPQGATSTSSNLRTWASVAVARVSTKGYDLEFCPPTYVDNKPVIEMTDEDLQAANPKLQDCLVGYYIGRRIPFKVTEATFKKVWGVNLVEVMANGKGFFFFHIPDNEFQRKVLEGGHFTVSKVPIVLQQWRPALELRMDAHLTVPVWVKLINLPAAFFSSQAISKVASAVGRPLYVDQRTEHMKMLAYARVCVEITAKQPSCETIEVVHHGESCVVDIEYEWRPTACAGCGIFGHKCNPVAACSIEKNVQQPLNVTPPIPQYVSLAPAPPALSPGHANPPQHVQTKDNM